MPYAVSFLIFTAIFAVSIWASVRLLGRSNRNNSPWLAALIGALCALPMLAGGDLYFGPLFIGIMLAIVYRLAWRSTLLTTFIVLLVVYVFRVGLFQAGLFKLHPDKLRWETGQYERVDAGPQSTY